MSHFDEAADRLKYVLRISNYRELAEALGLSATAFSERKRRNSFPEGSLRILAGTRPDLGIDVDYVLTGNTKVVSVNNAEDGQTKVVNRQILRIRYSVPAKPGFNPPKGPSPEVDLAIYKKLQGRFEEISSAISEFDWLLGMMSRWLDEGSIDAASGVPSTTAKCASELYLAILSKCSPSSGVVCEVTTS